MKEIHEQTDGGPESEIEKHLERCDFLIETPKELKMHIQSCYMLVNISLKPIKDLIRCDKCSYTCKLNIQLKKYYTKFNAQHTFEGHKMAPEVILNAY